MGVADGQTSLRALAWLFLRLGTTAFGGPAAHISMMREEVVCRRRWMTEEHFLDLLGATHLIPGPNSTEMAIHVGWERRRWAGLVVAGLAFILPAMFMTGALGWVYVRFGALPELGGLLAGVKPVVLGIVVQALGGLARTALKTRRLQLLGGAALLLAGLGVHELVTLFGVGCASVVWHRLTPRRPEEKNLQGIFGVAAPLAPMTLGVALTPVTLPSLFGVFLKTGSVLFGSGYVLLAFLRADLVERLGWMSESQLLDAIAVGQVTPGPVFTTATFIGYVLHGPSGALVATAGIFLPAFVFVALSGRWVPKLRASTAAGAFLDGVNVASLALMAVVTVTLGRAAIVDVPSALLGVGAAVLLLRFKVNSTWLILGGALWGLR